MFIFYDEKTITEEPLSTSGIQEKTTPYQPPPAVVSEAALKKCILRYHSFEQYHNLDDIIMNYKFLLILIINRSLRCSPLVAFKSKPLLTNLHQLR